MMRKIAAVAVFCAVLPACTGDDTVQESVDGGYFPSDATAYDSTVAAEDAGEDGGEDAMTPVDAGHDATTTDANDGGGEGGGADSGNDAGVDAAGAIVDSGEDAAG
jgi:hypothetical protein